MSAYDTYIRRLNRHFWDYVESDPDLFAGHLDTDEANNRRPTRLHIVVIKENPFLMACF